MAASSQHHQHQQEMHQQQEPCRPQRAQIIMITIILSSRSSSHCKRWLQASPLPTSGMPARPSCCRRLSWCWCQCQQQATLLQVPLRAVCLQQATQQQHQSHPASSRSSSSRACLLMASMRVLLAGAIHQ